MDPVKFRVSVVYEIEVDPEKVRYELFEVDHEPTEDELEEAADQIWEDNGPEISSLHYLGTVDEVDGGHLERFNEVPS